jgi:hypothetical protein
MMLMFSFAQKFTSWGEVMTAVRLFVVNSVAGGIGLHAPSVAGLTLESW